MLIPRLYVLGITKQKRTGTALESVLCLFHMTPAEMVQDVHQWVLWRLTDLEQSCRSDL